MPAALTPPTSPSRLSAKDSPSGITKLTNCRLVKGSELVQGDLWISSITGKILRSQETFYDHQATPDSILDLGGRIVSPGFIDVQLNGAFGFDFSVVPDDISAYAKGVQRTNKELIKTGVTSYLPTLTSQRSHVYHKALRFLGPSGRKRNASDGAESLGAHCEGPFISPTKNGIHSVDVLIDAPNGFSDLEECYGSFNLPSSSSDTLPSPIKLITLAPELPGLMENIPALVERGIIVSIGHSEATFELASSAIRAGATMITHLFNAMRPLHHRNPGIFGTLGVSSAAEQPKPYFGIIADGIHLHPTSVEIAWRAHPEGMCLVTDAMSLAGCEDGVYDWTNGSRIEKRGGELTLVENGKIAGSAVSLIECVSNFLTWSGASIPEAVRAVTETPAKMLGLHGVKGCLEPDADADLLVLSEESGEDGKRILKVDQVWKFGKVVHGDE